MAATATNTPVSSTSIPTSPISNGVLTSLGPQGGFFHDLVVDPQTPTTLYAVAYPGGLSKSTDGGGNWHTIATGLTRSDIWALVIDPLTPTILYAGAVDGELLKSMDGGENWSLISHNMSFRTLVINPLTPTTLYATTESEGIFKSMDGGEHWSQTGLPKRSVFYALAIDPTAPNTLYAGRGSNEKLSGVYKTTDSGETWSETGLIGAGGTSIMALVIDPKTPGTIYAGTDLNGIFKSTDGGGTWSAINVGLPPKAEIHNLIIDPKMPNAMYAGTYVRATAISGNPTGTPGIFKSTDGGAHWSAVNTGVNGISISTLTISASDSLYAAIFPFGIFKSTDSGGTWYILDASPIATTIYSVIIDPLTPTTLYVTANSGGEIFKSIDGGATWHSLNTSADMKGVGTLVIDPSNPDTLYAGTQQGLFKSTDGGESWNAVKGNGLPHNGVNLLKIDPVTTSTIYVATYGSGFFKSTDGGENWLSLDIPQVGPQLTWVHDLAIDPTMSTTLYTNTDYGIFKSTDGGTSWHTYNANPGLIYEYSKVNIRFLVIDSKTPITFYAAFEGEGFKSTGSSGSKQEIGDEDLGIFKSTDGGENWHEINTGIPITSYLTNTRVTSLMIDPTTSSTLYARTADNLFKSIDGGANWYPLNTGLSKTLITSLAIDPSMPDTLYLGTSGHGLFFLKLTK